jgi:membrane protein required for colicin V production
MLMGLSLLDWAILLIVVLSVLQAAAQGFFSEAFSLAGVVLGYLLAAWEYPHTAEWYRRYVTSSWAADIAGFLTVFLLVVLLAGIAGRIA